jgi:putative addiction module component (TIGR02574 family)
MEKEAADLLAKALRLPDEARAALADSLLESLDTEVDDGAEEAWRQEIHRRLAEIDAGAVQLVPWEEARKRLGDRVRR